MKTYLFHGQAGAGKDTQVEMILKKYDVERIATGEMMRKMKEEGDPYAVEVFKKVAQGIWPNPEETFTLFAQWIKRFDPKKDWILVSVARYVDQIPFLDKVLTDVGRKLDKVIHFTLTEGKALERLAGRKICSNCQGTFHPTFKPEKIEGICDLCGGKLEVREDDKPESIKKRFEQYAVSIKPYVEEFNKRGILIEIDASPSIEEIHKEVLKHLEFSNERQN
ncbi:MAG: Adenylate kinase [candidate division WS6 bacterium GW2011_GWF2_39_15]|uniref:Adenylate kinase n=1 Tax=candidate division WS6 bacterium GW2011_GWF2_39_15 TaxID=1619100 RepID=A0A0G0Q5H6_9BACT|nr:MAG: Adenylate kinase [candidate division WS6 bacterium GW2011_GWF2_39_15]